MKIAALAGGNSYVLLKITRSTRLYRSKVKRETAVPFSRFSGATQRATNVVMLRTPG